MPFVFLECRKVKCQGLQNKHIIYHDTYNLHDVDFISDNNNSAFFPPVTFTSYPIHIKKEIYIGGGGGGKLNLKLVHVHTPLYGFIVIQACNLPNNSFSLTCNLTVSTANTFVIQHFKLRLLPKLYIFLTILTAQIVNRLNQRNNYFFLE